MRTFPLRATDNNRISISCGIVSITPNIANPEMLIKAADSALYAAKNEGRNQVVIKTGELH
jgi:diguanylate cyclase (GGDEF)-like protein